LHTTSGQHVDQTYSGHFAPITRVDMHPGISQSEKNSDISDLMLSSSMDWTVKLWYPKIRTDPLITFESSQDYVYDVQWSTVHPSVFATCDGEGYVDVWDINRDIEAPIARKKTGAKALNSLKWSLDGRKIATGDAEGFVSLWGVDKEFQVQKNEDFNKLERLISSNQHQNNVKAK
jgi:dynein intermediate chain